MTQSKYKVHLGLAVLFFLAMSMWWLTIYSRNLIEGTENNAFTLVYPLASFFGSLAGFYISRSWGGLRSKLGQALVFFSLGLFAQFLGQAIYAYYIYVKGIEVPYPSLGDFGYFGSVLLYVVGIAKLSNVIGVSFSLRSFGSKLAAILVPIALLAASYAIFLRGYEFDWSAPMVIFLDFGYPLGQAIYVSMAILALLLSKDFLGGIMKGPMTFLIVALVMQYVSDFTFLYQANRETWYVGGPNDYLYMLSYLAMAVALIFVGRAFGRVKESHQ